MEPFERGYGHTLGNALRRVLLSSMPGYAPTEVQDHRRAARVLGARRRAGGRRRRPAEPQGRRAEAAQPRPRDAAAREDAARAPVTAADIEPNHDVEIINPDHVIAHLTAGGKLEMEIKRREGPRLPAGDRAREAGRRPHDRQHPARRVVLAGAPRELRGRERARRAAHRPRQAGARHRDQRRRRARAGGALRRVACWSSSCRCSPISRARTRRPPSARRRRSTRSCCARSTTSSSRCARPTASRPRTSTTSAT